MFFEAIVNKSPYKVTVNEERKSWLISIQSSESEGWKEISIPKENFQLSNDGQISLIHENSSYLVDIIPEGTDYTVFTRGSHRNVSILNDERILRDSLMGRRGLGGLENLKAGMPGKIVKVFVKPGDKVSEDQPLLIMEAMKMENEMRASGDLIIDKIHVKEGGSVESGALLISFKEQQQ